MPNKEYWLSILSGEQRGFQADALRAGLTALEGLYSCGLAVYLGAESVGLRRRARLPVPVISIGNITVGGTGKTPMTQWLARRLQSAGERPAVLNRGHGGAIAPQAALVTKGDGTILLTAAEAGDEAVVLAQSLSRVAVAVGKNRRESGELVIEAADPTIILLDDGMQYWQLARTLDLVLVDSRIPLDNGHALPRGLLREPLRGLRRAGIIVCTRSDQVSETGRSRLRELFSRLAPQAPIFFAAHRAGRLVALNEQARGHAPGNPLLVCGIGQPLSFERTVREAGIAPAGVLAFPDHQPYGDVQKKLIAGNINDTRADSVIVTAKDSVKMPQGYLNLPIFVLEVGMTFEDEDGLWQAIVSRCKIGDSGNADDKAS